jgi:hypothetical protein
MEAGVAMYGIYALYKFAVLVAGVLFSYMGFRLFLADKVAAAGDLTANSGTYSLTLRGAAPGTFFCVMGAVLIVVSLVVKKSDFEITNEETTPGIERVIPDRPPAGLE